MNFFHMMSLIIMGLCKYWYHVRSCGNDIKDNLLNKLSEVIIANGVLGDQCYPASYKSLYSGFFFLHYMPLK